MPFVVGWCIALICNPLVKFLEKRLKLVRKHSSAVIVAVVLAGVIRLLYFLVSRLILGVMMFCRELPQLYEVWQTELQGAFAGFSVILERMPTAVQEAVNRTNSNLGALAGEFGRKVSDTDCYSGRQCGQRNPGSAGLNSVAVRSYPRIFLLLSGIRSWHGGRSICRRECKTTSSF